MELTVRILAVALLGAAVGLLLKRSGPALALPLAAAVCAYALHATLTALRPAASFLREAEAMTGLSGAYLLPVTKCVAIGILSRLGADLCRDAGQTAMAGAVELGAAAAALAAALPLLQALLGMLDKLV